MTVGAGSVVLGPFIPNGQTTAWPFSFAFSVLEAGEVTPRLVTDAGSSIPAHSIAFNTAADGEGGGGSVVIDPPLAPGSGQLFISYLPQITQTVAFEDQARFSPAVMNGALDRGAARDQYLDARLDRAQKVQLGELGPPVPSQARRADSFRLWSGDGSAERTDITRANLAGVLESELEATLARRDLANVADATLRARVLGLGLLPQGPGGGQGGLDLRAYLDPFPRVEDPSEDPAGWTDVSQALRQAFADAGDMGVNVDASQARGIYFIDPATPILVRRGSGFIGPDTGKCQLSYRIDPNDPDTGEPVPVDDSDDVDPRRLKEVVLAPGLTFLVDIRSAHKDVPKFALQGQTVTRGLQIAGVGLAAQAAGLDVTSYPTIGGVYPQSHAPVIVTDHVHNPDGSPVAAGEAAKAGGVTLDCHLTGLLQGVYIGDPLIEEEPWAGLTASGKQTGLSTTDVTISASTMLRVMAVARSTTGGLTCRIQAIPPNATIISQPRSGGLTDYALLKYFQQFGVVLDMWHRAVGFDVTIQARGFRYGVHMQAGYSPEGPSYDAPKPGTRYPVGALASNAAGDVFRCTQAGVCTVAPARGAPGYDEASRIFSDGGSTLSWIFVTRRQDTGKYNAGIFRLGCERVITPIHVAANAYMHRVNIVLGGHYMDEYNLKGETGPLIEVLSEGAVAGAIDKAVYDGFVARHYDIGDKISATAHDAVGNEILDAGGKPMVGVYSVTTAGDATAAPFGTGFCADPDPASTLVWRFRNGGFKPFGDVPFARWYASGVINETAGPAFLNTPNDGHVFVGLDGLSVAQWCQATHQGGAALIQNRSPLSVVSHKAAQTFATGNSMKVYDVADESRLRVGGNDYFGPYSMPLDGSDPSEISNGLSAGFFTGKNCFVYNFGAAGDDDPVGDDPDD